ncbi:protein of unknown function [Streptomyces murinus]
MMGWTLRPAHRPVRNRLAHGPCFYNHESEEQFFVVYDVQTDQLLVGLRAAAEQSLTDRDLPVEGPHNGVRTRTSAGSRSRWSSPSMRPATPTSPADWLSMSAGSSTAGSS